MGQLQRYRRAATASLLAVLAYAAVAYLVTPEFWSFHDRSRITRPMLTSTPQGIPGDPLNVGLVGSREELIRAFARAGWTPADAITLRTAIEIGESVILGRPYADAPVSTLLYDGRRQDLAFEKPVGVSAHRRHHVRFWLMAEPGADGRPLWLGSASFDRGVGLSRDTGQITHRIAPDLDAERDLIMRDLAAAGQLLSTYSIPGIGPTEAGRNGGGDLYRTDGTALVGVLAAPP